MDTPRRESVERFARVAAEDLRVARSCLAMRPAAYAMAAFHAQQAAEKHIKAWLVALGEDEPPLVHALAPLGRLLAARGGLELPHEPLEFLSRFAVAPRYGFGEPLPAEAERAVAVAVELAVIARGALRDLGALE